MSHLDQFPDGFHQLPDFRFPTLSGVCYVNLGVLPSERLLIASEAGLMLSDSDFSGLAVHASQAYQFDSANLVLIFYYPAKGLSFDLVEFDARLLRPAYLGGNENFRALRGEFRFLRLIHLFSTSCSELSPAHLRQLVGMLPAIRQQMVQGGAK